MAFGSGSSLATDFWRRRRGFPCSLQLFKVGKASRLHQHSSKKPTAQLVSYLVGIFAPVAGEQDLATAQGEGIRRAQSRLQRLTLGVAKGTHKDRSFHALEDNPQLPSCLGMH